MYFKSSLTALSHAMEDQVLAGNDHPLVIANFQRERFYRQEARRYLRIAERTNQVYVLAAPETDFANRSNHYETIAFDPTDTLAQEWHLVVVGARYGACLICRERQIATPSNEVPVLLAADQSRRFEGIWTFDRKIVVRAAEFLLDRILEYRPELAAKVVQAKSSLTSKKQSGFNNVDPGPFAERLTTYLQAGQYKLLKAYRSITIQARKERLVNSITSAIRRSLNTHDILNVAVQELGQTIRAGRCLVYRCKETDASVLIQHQYLGASVVSLLGQRWNLASNPLFRSVVRHQETLQVDHAQAESWSLKGESLVAPRSLVQEWQITSWLMVPVINQNRLLGMIEVHHCEPEIYQWTEGNLELLDAIATQIGVALIQAEAYTHLEDLNQQLEALDRTRSNLIAITGHELRTPLSTIQVCLESLASEPDMAQELQQVMIQSALADAERMRKLVQDFLTLSQLESGRIEWHLEALPVQECVDLALSSLRARQYQNQLPTITTPLPPDLPMVMADGEWVVEVLSKLLDNACKFTDPTGRITIQAEVTQGDHQKTRVEIIVSDTGRGIEPNRLEAVFDRFYQEEGALRRTTGGTGLGLAICRQIIQGLGGQIWAESAGKDQGAQFHLTLPIFQAPVEEKLPTEPNHGKSRTSKTKTS
jgi:DICT domain-containing protein/signal transduction histidine kinase